MSSDRPTQTLADYVAIALSPALIMGLVTSLVFFLLTVLYNGDYVGRLQWILFFFVFGAVLIARISMSDVGGRAAFYGVPLGLLVWIGMQMFVDYPEDSAIKDLSWFINAGLIGLVWWCAHRLTWDCTHVDEQSDIASEGLLQAAGLEKEPEGKKTEEEKPAEPEGFLARWQRYREERKKKRPLGVWVVYFSLAALPLFGLGQALIEPDDTERRRAAFWLMIVYVGCGLGLLLTTCFLSLRRYLRQRKLKMPAAMTGVWLTVGGSLIAALLVLGAVLPRPDAEYSLFHIGSAKSDKRGASRFAFLRGSPGKGEGQPGADDKDGKGDPSNSGGQGGKQKGGDQGPSRPGEKGSGKDGKGGQGDRQGKDGGQSGRNQNNSGQNQNKGDPGSGRDQPAPKGGQKNQRNDGGRSSQDRDGEKSNSDRSERRGDNSSSTSRPSASALRDVVSKVGPVLKWVVFAILGLAVVFFLLRSGLQFLANFSDWAKRLLDSLRTFWAGLFGGWGRAKAEDGEGEEEERVIPERPFASFRNPFTYGGEMTVPELIRYTFAAVQAWARERDLGRQPGETPLEFAARVGQEVPALEADLLRLAALYARAVYARGGLPGNSAEVLRQFWERLEAVAEQPLSA
jgi:hypothetical protein